MNACQEGCDWFNEEFPDGADYSEVLNAAKYHDTVNGDIGREAFARMMARNSKAWLQMEGTKLKDVYHVFNPLTGQHTTCNSLEEAKETRQQYIQDYIETQKNMFSVAQEIENSDGDTLWNPIDIDKM
jgi:hypothetical protein